jgi:3-dehydroquinate dehydratase/shikimate dehydrogenase
MSRSLLCETVVGRSMAELLAARDASRDADMVELRLDGVADLDVAAAVHGSRLPVVLTCRPAWEGGRFTGTEQERHDILERAVATRADYVDIEWATLSGALKSAFAELIRRAPERVILSAHDFEGVPADLLERTREMRAAGAGTIKVAVTAHGLTDTLRLREVARDGSAVVIAMGEPGVASRLLASRFGSRWTYAGAAIAPGQIPAARMIDDFRFREIGPETRLFGVVSTNAMHSLSPVMHNAAFAAGGVDAVYVPLQTTHFDDFLAFAAAIGLEGASVTIPFKRDALRAADRADALTREVGAANTLRRPAGAVTGSDGAEHESDRAGWEATNTDVAGFLVPLESMLGDLRGVRVSVLGGGGAARAVVVALRSRGARITVHTRRREQAEDVTAALEAAIGAWPVPGGSWDVLVNCTPLGGAALRDESPLPGGPFSGRLVYDLTYGPGESALIREARAAGCLTLDGLPMLVAQAERQFEWWTGRSATPGVMHDAAACRVGRSGVV